VIIENISYLVLVFITAFFKFSFKFILVSNLASQIIVILFLVLKLKNKLPKPGLPVINFLYIKESYAFGLHLFFTGLGGFGLQRIGFYILNYFSGTRSVGLYTVASTLPTIYENLPQQISTIAYTYVAGENDVDLRKKIAVIIVKLVLYCVVIAAIPIFLFADQIVVLIFGNEFVGLGMLTLLLTISTIFSGLSGIFYNFLAGIGKPKYGTYLTILNLLLTFITSLFFIYYFGLFGAAWAKLISSVVSATYIGYFFLRYYKIKLIDILWINNEEWYMLVKYIKHLSAR
jgi:O-antigen/teichoic acid export membrane protein